MDFKLRRAESTDRPYIENLFMEMLRTIYQKDDVEGYEDGYLDRFFNTTGDRQGAAEDAGDMIYVAETDDRVVAFLSLEVHRGSPDFIYLDDFSVSGDYRGKGIGTSLVRAAQCCARERGISRLVLHVEKSNVRAYKLYRRMGFEQDKEEGDRIRMRKLLAGDGMV